MVKFLIKILQVSLLLLVWAKANVSKDLTWVLQAWL
ncbi:uncharacterized protein PRCAT00003757001 [Priceomyces carsonii]|nr:unnamed protein product [Priceomyces carsonii]